MLFKSEIEKSFKEQNERLQSGNWVNRSIIETFSTSGNHIEVISGIRRCGKSTLMRQLIQQCKQKFAFFNFEDSRIFGFDIHDFPKLDEVIDSETDVYFFDEIQNVLSWEIYVRQLHDRGKKVFITGSNASLLSKELGTRLTGRNIRHELFPFGYKEFTKFTQTDNAETTVDDFLVSGGFPEYLESRNIEMLQHLLKDILFRDIAIRYGIRNTQSLFEIALFLLSNIGKPITYNSLRKSFRLGSANTASDYLKWMEEAYLFFYLPKFSWSAKESAVNPRKVYAIDNGLICANTLSFTKDSGRILENLVHLQLRKKNSPVFYFKEKNECDFVIFENRKCKAVIQVCQELNNDNKGREIDGLKEAMNFFGLKEGFIITRFQDDNLSVDGFNINIVSLRNFLTN